MAPEIHNYLELAASGKYTNAVDLWAVGCIIYRLITGVVPFPRETSLIQYCEDTFLFPNDLLIDHGVRDIGSNFLRQLLAIDPKERISAAKALRHHWITSREYYCQKLVFDTSLLTIWQRC
jgi:calcium/calmodulin-dependent protein kinase I